VEIGRLYANQTRTKKRSKPFEHQSLYAKKILEIAKTLIPD